MKAGYPRCRAVSRTVNSSGEHLPNRCWGAQLPLLDTAGHCTAAGQLVTSDRAQSVKCHLYSSNRPELQSGQSRVFPFTSEAAPARRRCGPALCLSQACQSLPRPLLQVLINPAVAAVVTRTAVRHRPARTPWSPARRDNETHQMCWPVLVTSVKCVGGQLFSRSAGHHCILPGSL